MRDTSKYKNIITEELLTEYYCKNGLNPTEISKIFGCNTHVIYRLLKKFNLQEDRTGQIKKNQTFGNFTTIEKIGQNSNGTFIWKCKCICGNYKNLLTSVLKANDVKSCGCLNKNKSNHHLWTGFKDISGNKWKNIEASAKKRNYEFLITKEEVWDVLEKQNFKCALSNLNISFNDNTASIDRINPNIGYFNNNIWLVHKDINRIKWSCDLQNFLNWSKTITFPLIKEEKKFSNIFIYCSLWKNIIYNSNKRNLKINISLEDISTLFVRQNGQCALTGVDIVLPNNCKDFRKKNFTASLDRIDSNLDYNIDNIQWVHKFINQSRSNFSISYYKHLFKLVYEKQFLQPENK